jgi:hypothetical protein
VPKTGQKQEKPEKTCGNPTNPVDKAFRKAEGELRYGFFRTRMNTGDSRS